MTTADTQTNAPKSSRRQLWLVVAMFFVPLGIAFLMYYGNVGWRPEGSTNKGELIDPARPLPEVALMTPSGTPTAPDFLRGKWSIVFVGAGRLRRSVPQGPDRHSPGPPRAEPEQHPRPAGLPVLGSVL